jgi:hypothetical protein
MDGLHENERQARDLVLGSSSGPAARSNLRFFLKEKGLGKIPLSHFTYYFGITCLCAICGYPVYVQAF